MTETQTTYTYKPQTSCLDFRSQPQTDVNVAPPNTSNPVHPSSTFIFRPIATAGDYFKTIYRVCIEDVCFGMIAININGTWNNSICDLLYGTPYEAAGALIEAPIRFISIPDLLDKPFDELTRFEWELLKSYNAHMREDIAA